LNLNVRDLREVTGRFNISDIRLLKNNLHFWVKFQLKKKNIIFLNLF
jgi:hypothetical protein